MKILESIFFFICSLILANTLCIAQIPPKKTYPGVYIQEKNTSSLSIAQVETAIPAFIGYTEKAGSTINRNLLFTPEKISSLAEYERLYGVEGNTQQYILHPSLQLYFANGGTDCYIVSIGVYKSFNKSDFIKGLEAVSKIDEVTLLLFPDAINLPGYDLYEVQRKALQQAATLGDRFCILDLKEASFSTEHNTMVREFRSLIGRDNLKYGAVYTPHLKTPIPTIKSLPPSAAVAGQYCQVDRTRGVWKAPANVSLRNINDLLYQISSTEEARLNVDPVAGLSINTIKKISGKGIVVWGARTLAGNDNEWRYIPVRRFFIIVEESIKKSIQSFVFEPNDPSTWARIKTMIQNYLITQWREGALSGAKTSEAYFVKVGLGETMTNQDILNKKMIVEIGMAPIRPAEFIIIRIVLNMN